MKLSCEIVRDLLPLYAEELASEGSVEMVRRHLEDCEDCRRTYEEMKKPPVVVPEEPDLKTVRRQLWKRRFLTALCAVLVVCGLGCWSLSWLTEPIYLDKSIITNIEVDEDGIVLLTFDAAAVGEETFQYEVEVPPEGETFTAWTSHWLRMKWNEQEPRKTTVPSNIYANGTYYFTGQDGEELVLLYENPVKYVGGDVVPLPRLFLGFYFLMSLLLGVVLMILAFVLRKGRTGKWLGLIGSFLCCYGLCQGIVCGFTFASFFAQQELFWGVAMGVCMWGALMCLWGMRKH